MFNQVILIGHTGMDPEIKKLEQGKVIAKTSLATSERFMKNGETATETQWHQITAWGNLAQVFEKYVTKGSKIQIVGQIKYNTYEKDGVKMYSTEIEIGRAHV